jgi:TonB family protein
LSRRYILAAGVVGITVAATVIAPRVIGHRSASEPPASASAILQNEPTAKQSQSDAPVAKTTVEGTRGVVRQDILNKVLPDVPAQARNTIRGKINIRIRVNVDASGSVKHAISESSGSSRFFGNLALQAARQWKFAPESSNEWILRFQFVRDPNNSVSVQATPSK